MNAFDELCNDEVVIKDSAGRPTGPFKCAFSRSKVTIFSEDLSVSEGDKLLRTLPSGKTESYSIMEVTFHQQFHGIPASFTLLITKDTSLVPRADQRTTNINISHSQAFQIGDHNAQQIAASINVLVSQIDAADAPDQQKNEAKGRLREFLTHPLVTAILGGASGGLADLVK